MDTCLLEWGPGKHEVGRTPASPTLSDRPPGGQAGPVPMDPPTPANSCQGCSQEGAEGCGDVMGSLVLLAAHRQRKLGSERAPRQRDLAAGSWQPGHRGSCNSGNSGSAEGATQTQPTL